MPEAVQTPAAQSAPEESPRAQKRRPRDWFRTAIFLLCVLGLGGLGTYWLVRDALESGAFTDGERLLDAKQLPDRRRVLWEEPVPLGGSFNTADRETEGSLDAEGDTLLYCVGQPGSNVEIWVAERSPAGNWQSGHPLREVNSLADDQAPLLVGDRLYFASDRSGGYGGFDLYVSERQNGVFGAPRNLGPLVNSAADDVDPSADSSGYRVLFASNRASGSKERFDLFESLGDGEMYGEAARVLPLSSDSNDRHPCLTSDGLGLVFSSDRSGGEGGFDLYRSVWDGSTWLGPFPAGSVNTKGDEVAPRLSADGFSMVFASDRIGGEGDLDLYRAQSRELFPIDADLDLYDKIAGTILLFILTLLLLLFLGKRWKALDIIAKCLLLSLLIHLLLLLWFRTIEVTGELVARQAGGKSFKVRVMSSPKPSERPEANRARGDVVSLERSLADARPTSAPELTAQSSRELRPTQTPLERLERDAGEAPARPESEVARNEQQLQQQLPESAELAAEAFERKTGADQGFEVSSQSVDVNRSAVASSEAPDAAPASASEMASPHAIEQSRGQLQEVATAERVEASTPQPRASGEAPSVSSELTAEAPTQRRSGQDTRFTTSESAVAVERATGSDAPLVAQNASLEATTDALPDRPNEVGVQRREAPLAQGAARPDSAPTSATPVSPSAAQSTAPLTAETSDAVRRSAADPEAAALAASSTDAPRQGTSELPSAAGVASRMQNASSDAAPIAPSATNASRLAMSEARTERTAPSVERASSSSAPSAARPLEIERSEIGLKVSAAQPRLGESMQPRATSLAPSRTTLPSTPRPLAAAPRPLNAGPSRPQPELRRSAMPERSRMPERSTAFEPTARTEVEVPEVATELEVETPAATTRPAEALAMADPLTATKLTPRDSEVFSRRDVFDLSPRSFTATAQPVGPRNVALDRLDRKPDERVATRTPARVARTPYQARFGDEKRLALETFGGNAASERAVQRGLEYLASIQNEDGYWGSERHRHSKYRQVSIGKTSLALLAFLGAGHTQFSETKYSKLVKRTVAYLIEEQDDRTGHFGDSNAYSHGISTYALAENFALTGDETVRPALERGLQWILRNQRMDPSEGELFGGWGYYMQRGTPSDRWPRASVTAWQIMALESARIGGLEVPDEHLAAARTYLENSFDRRRRAFRYTHDPSRLRSSWPILPGSTPASVFALLLLGADSDDVSIEMGVRYIRERTPRGYAPASDDDFVLQAQANLYFWYYATLAMFLRGGEDWEYWNAHLRDMLIDAQNEDGSWRPISQYANYANDNEDDKSYTTAMCVLMLEVYYRYFTPLLREQGRIGGSSLGGR
ncbi:MAG: hypothetical protein RL885_00770 [Planctomycetota bacterium]